MRLRRLTGRKPDISFLYPDRHGRALPDRGPDGFIADITTVSDAGLDNANPVNLLSEELPRLARAAGLNPAHIGCSVGHQRLGPYGDQRTVLLLPKPPVLTELLKTTVLPFFRDIARASPSRRQLEITEQGASFVVTFDSSQRFTTFSYASYNSPGSPKRNPLWNKLHEKARRQLKGISSTVPRGIIVCDAGCAVMRKTFRSPGAFTADEIVREFFRQHSSISFILLISAVREERGPHEGHMRLRSRLAISPTLGRQTRRLWWTLEAAIRRLPPPVLDPLNASIRCREDDYGMGYRGGGAMSKNTVTISSRLLVELLSGRRTVKDMNDDFGWRSSRDSGSGTPNPFERFLAQGRMITKLEVKEGVDESDGWVTFEFGAPHPAISSIVPR